MAREHVFCFSKLPSETGNTGRQPWTSVPVWRGLCSLRQTGAGCGFLACCVTEPSEVSRRGRREGRRAFLQARPAQPVRSSLRPEVPVHPALCLLTSAVWLLPHVAPRVGGWPSVMGGVSAGRSQAAPSWSHVAACLSQESTSG